ncbi:helix-turn-helix transcriptional regulator [Eggerthella sinensis]|uniref:helix-turn-helix transcriptional regulator n=1 Tax=Eggerthella sinensis TaxID=242230 RepID=UPI00248ED32D|nr:helix-turn-helix transcriptional regulator [Eggerthella sinensis]
MEIETRDCRDFMRDFETPGTRAFDHALDLSVMIWELMQEKGLSKTELARRMGVSKSNLSNLLNTQPNMTLETIARFELALDVKLEFRFVPKDARDSAADEEPASAQG